MARGVWKDGAPAKRRAAAIKAAQSRARGKSARERARQCEAQALHDYLHNGGPPLPAPEQGGAQDRVLQGKDIKATIGRAIAALRERDAEHVEAAE